MQAPPAHTGAPSPLIAIKQKELALAAELSLAKQAAEREVEAARRWAAEFVRQLEGEARQAAAAGYRAALEAADEQDTHIRVGGERAAAAVMAAGSPRVAEAAERIVAIVVPRVEPGAAMVAGDHKAQVDHA